MLNSAEKGSGKSHLADGSFEQEREKLFAAAQIPIESIRRGLLVGLDFAKHTTEFTETEEYATTFAKFVEKNYSNPRAVSLSNRTFR